MYCLIFRLELVTYNGHRRYDGGTCALSWYDVKVLQHTFHSSFISSCWESSLLVNIMWLLLRALRQAWYCFFMTWPLSYYFLLWWIIVISVSTNELILIVLFGCCLSLLLVCDGSRIYCRILFRFARSMRTCSAYGTNLLNYFKIILIMHVWSFLKFNLKWVQFRMVLNCSYYEINLMFIQVKPQTVQQCKQYLLFISQCMLGKGDWGWTSKRTFFLV